MGLFRKLTVVGVATSFARSERGQRAIAEARQRLDTPANRERLRQGVEQATTQVRRAAASRRSA